MAKNVDFLIKKYLENRPMFLALIRTSETLLFLKHSNLIKKPVLDFGCGDGFFTETVFNKKNINVGLDIHDSRIRIAEKEKIYKQVAVYDELRIPFPDNYFTTIISNCVLEHIPNLDLALAEIYRVLKPGGYFLTTLMTNKWNDYLFGKKLLGKWYVEYMKKKQAHYNLFSYQQWFDLFERSKFKIIKSIGYLNKKNSLFIDLAHYLSLPSLITYKLFNNWQLFPKLTNLLWQPYISKYINIDVKVNESSALFFILKK